MKILNPGKAKMLKLVCPNCGCEFVYEYFGHVLFSETARVNCPQEGCKEEVFLQSGEPYEGPTPTTTQSDRERLREAIKKWLLDPDAKSADELVDRLIAHGVTFKENT